MVNTKLVENPTVTVEAGKSAPKFRTRVWKRFVASWHPFLMRLYRLHLGWLLGHSLVIITHIGRRSGQVRRTIVYVQDYNHQTRETKVVAAWGITDWYRNICVTPAVEIEIGQERYVPEQRLLEPAEIMELEWQFRQRHPLVARVQCWLMDWPWHCSETEFMDYARSLRGVAFRPK